MINFSLMNIKAGQTAKVVRVLDCEARRRLLDFGFTPGTEICVHNIAPLKSTVLVGLRGYTVALRENAARMVEVE
jgi:ferrous iron transport protein A